MYYTLYTDSTPNSFKISIKLEEISLCKGKDYKVINLDFPVNEQKTPEFLAINPNGKIPLLIDHTNQDFIIIESRPILLYLAEKHSLLPPKDFSKKSETLQWLMWQVAGSGSMFGQFMLSAVPYENRLPEATEPYARETKRMLGILNLKLEKTEYVAAGEHTLADIACYPWVRMMNRARWPMSEFPALKIWFERLSDRPAYQRGIGIPGNQHDEKRLKGLRMPQWSRLLNSNCPAEGHLD